MSRLPFELLLALRVLRPKRTCCLGHHAHLHPRWSCWAWAVLIIVISVMSGFDHDLREKVFGFNAHLKVCWPTTITAGLRVSDGPGRRQSARSRAVAPVCVWDSAGGTQPEFGQKRVFCPARPRRVAQAEATVSALPRSTVLGEIRRQPPRLGGRRQVRETWICTHWATGSPFIRGKTCAR